jgi:hypothetical protein
VSEGNKPSWGEGVEEIKLGTWRDALEKASGNISRAAKAIHIARSYAMTLTKRFELTAFAAELRARAGGTKVRGGPRSGVVTGRPRSR